MSGPVEIVVIIAAVGYVLARRLLGEPAEARRMLILPLVLTVIGLTDLVKVAQTPLSIAFLVGSTAISVLIGALRGASVRVYEQNGIAFLRYTVLTIVLWVVNIAVKFGASFVLGLVSPAAAHATGNGLMLTLGAGMLVEGLVVLAKAVRGNGQIVWQKGKNGRPHTTAGYLDELQQRARRDR